jgi:hypothetical protein
LHHVNANTPTPRIFVIVMPDMTELATLTNAVHTLASLPKTDVLVPSP